MVVAEMRSSFGCVLKRYREEAGLTLAELSIKTDISSGTISKIETDSLTLPNMRNVIRLAETLDISLYEAVMPYLDKIKRTKTFELLLETAINQGNAVLTQKIASKLLECPKSNTFLSLDYLYQLAGNTENIEFRFLIYGVISQYSREHGIPVFLARSLYQKYLIQRDSFKKLDESYIEGMELLHYISYLHVDERVMTYYKLGSHALFRGCHEECIHLCKKGINEDHKRDELTAKAYLAIIIAYIELRDYILAKVYLDAYEQLDCLNVQKESQYLRAILYAKTTDDIEKAVPLLLDCLHMRPQNEKLPVVNDLLDIYIRLGDELGVVDIFESESSFLPTNVGTPNQCTHLGLYFRAKGNFYIEKGDLDMGCASLLESAMYYKKMMKLEEAIKSIGYIFEYYTDKKENLPFSILQKMEILYTVHNT
ncbi:helix-turn-helix transcriptional regulator [Brevibacillus sp. RS1.1]|uniref:helix-turn-helix domain-containing protein n=1 Tax=Brevibacillus sp. RS1.1 TaxID=2738982 RepID=UPI00156AF614|nr:helix-turn-helix transcriptional regulator [Brevibacillus sp. RS1.1]NRR03715.1 helix-turn-helix transcriptional regulator [Brevibacillus sp. RS1.1]